MTGKRKNAPKDAKQSTKQSQGEATAQSEILLQTNSNSELIDPIPSNIKVNGNYKYEPRFNEEALFLASQGKTLRGIAAKLGVCRETLYDWKKRYPEFSKTMDRCAELFADFMEHKNVATLVEHHQGIRLNNAGWKMLMARFPEYQSQEQPPSNVVVNFQTPEPKDK